MNLGVKKINIVKNFDEAIASSSTVRRNEDMSYRKSVTKIKKKKTKPKRKPLPFFLELTELGDAILKGCR